MAADGIVQISVVVVVMEMSDVNKHLGDAGDPSLPPNVLMRICPVAVFTAECTDKKPTKLYVSNASTRLSQTYAFYI